MEKTFGIQELTVEQIRQENCHDSAIIGLCNEALKLKEERDNLVALVMEVANDQMTNRVDTLPATLALYCIGESTGDRSKYSKPFRQLAEAALKIRRAE